jgi:N-hydroxyarylamine O-acetyltransferase
MIDLAAYFARIGYDGPREASVQVLRDLHALHIANIVFEDVDVQLGRGVDIAPQAVDAKLLHGGYCYEQNGLFKRVLEALGFQVDGLLGRVQWMLPAEPARGRTHMALRVTIDGEAWLADVGFGSALPNPIRFDIDAPQKTAHEDYRMVSAGRERRLEALIAGTWEPVYQLNLEPQLDVDYVQPNWFSSTHPTSNFLQNLIIARTTPTTRYNLLNNRLTIREAGEEAQKRVLNAAELTQVARDLFGLPVEADWAPVFERAAARE